MASTLSLSVPENQIRSVKIRIKMRNSLVLFKELPLYFRKDTYYLVQYQNC